MARYRKKPLVVDAMRVSEILALDLGKTTPGGVPEWLLEAVAVDPETDEGHGGSARMLVFETVLEVRTKQGNWVHAGPDEWILRAAPDDLWPVDPDVFEASYELEED